MDYSLIDTSAALDARIMEWNGLARIAVDFECEFNLHIYGEHLCLIQVFDGSSYYIIDPRANAISRESLLGFFTSPVKKVWFDCQSDNSLVFKKYGVTVNNICDVRVYALALGHTSNLVSLEREFLGTETVIEPAAKKRLQQTNWLRRPLEKDQIEYALSDVSSLFALEDVLAAKAEAAGLAEACAKTMRERQKPAESRPGWVTLGDWRRMSAEQRKNVKQYYIARDKVARRFNVPSFHVMDKRELLQFSLSCPSSKEAVLAFARKAGPRFRTQLQESLLQAFDIIHSQD